jgi:thioesterase domain-containing protein
MVAGLYFNRYDHESKEEGMKKYEDDYFRYFSTLVKNIGPQQPIFGFRPKGIFLYEKAHKNIKEMAASYILEMKKVQPEGPYLIGGECIGGIIALEMAQQLLTSGEKVKHLILLDTFYPRGKWLKIDSFYIIRNRIINELGQPFREKDLGNFRKIGHFFSQLQQFILPLTKKQRAIRNVNYGNIFYLIKLLKYKPQPYRSPEATIIANEEWAEGMNKTLEWKEKHFNPLNVIPIPGNHVTSLTDFGPVTGNLIREIIEKE